MEHKKYKRIFISGPVSSYLRNEEDGWLRCYNAFQLTEEKLHRQYPGAKVVNPMDLCDPKWCWLRCMIVCLRQLRKCDAVCMRPQWINSRGSRLENGFAIRWGKDILMEAGEYIHAMQEGGTR